MTVGLGGRVEDERSMVVRKVGAVAHDNLDFFAFPLKAARNGCTYSESALITEFNRWEIDEGVDAEAWALNDGVNLGGSLETYQRQEPVLGQQTELVQDHQIRVAATHRL